MQKEALQSLNSAPNQTQQTVSNANEIVEESKKTQAYNASQNPPKQDPKLKRRPVQNTNGVLQYYVVLNKKGEAIGYEDINGNPIPEPNSGPSPELVQMAQDKADGAKVSDSVAKINAEKNAGSTKYDTKESLINDYESDKIGWNDFKARAEKLGMSQKEIRDIVKENGWEKYKNAGAWAAEYDKQNDVAPTQNAEAPGVDNVDNTTDVNDANVTEEPTPEETVPEETVPEEKEAQEVQRKWQTRSIWQAWKDGEFGDPNTKDAKQARNYFLLNSLATFAQNQAERSANLANVYRGGQADASVGQNTSEWADIQKSRRENALGNELSSASALDTAGTNQTIAENFNSSEQRAQQLQNEYNAIVNKYADKQIAQQLDLTDQQIENLKKLNENQDIQNQILAIQKNYTAEQAQALLDQISAAIGLTNAQTALLKKQTDWYDANSGLGLLAGLLGALK